MKTTYTIAEIKNQFNNLTKFKLFEIAVIDNRTSVSTYILFDISIIGKSLIAQHEALNSKQAKSKKISFVKVVIDLDWSIDSNLECLFETCQDAIINSEYYTLN